MNRPIYHTSRSRRAPIKDILLSEAVDGFTMACNARKLSENTITDYSRTLRRFLVHVGNSPIRDITSAQIAAFLAAQPWSEKTVLNYHIGLAALWTWAMREDYVDKHIVRMTPRPRPRKLVIEPFTEQEIRALLASCRGKTAARNRAVILLLLDTGVRATELCELKFSDIDMQRRQIRVLGKGNKERLSPFSDPTEQALFDHLLAEHVKGTGERPFQFNRNSLAHLMQRIGNAAGVHDCHPHRFRHTFAVAYLRNGGDVFSLQEILGHSTMETVKIYLKIAQVDIDQAHRRASPVANWNL